MVVAAVAAVPVGRGGDDDCLFLALVALVVTLIPALIVTLLSLLLPGRVVVLAQALRVVVVLVPAVETSLAGPRAVPVLAAA